MANIIDAIENLVNNPINKLVEYYQGKNRANNMGDALEEYVKDLFANTFNHSECDRNERLSEVFSYLGNSSNPPDAMLYAGDAIEVKKIEKLGNALALNSSYPKHKISSSSDMITNGCRNAEDWTEKDMIYVVGVVNKNTLKHLCMVYGLDYCASDECYIRMRDKIKSGIKDIHGVEFTYTKELGKVKRVDPLGITDLRIRGMWTIENPWNAFDYVYKKEENKTFTFMCIINYDKWCTFDNVDSLVRLASCNNNLLIKDVRIKNPDNPAQLNNAKLITFSY